MKIAVSTTKGGLDDLVHPIFGRCLTFTFVDTKGKELGAIEVIQNPGALAGGGAGIAAAQAVVDAGAGAVITGNCGPNAIGVLSQSKIMVYAASGNVRKAVEDYLAGRLSSSESPGVPGHFGMGRGPGFSHGAGRGFKGGRV